MRKASTSIKGSHHKKVHQNKWIDLKCGKVPTSVGVTHANKIDKESFKRHKH